MPSATAHIVVQATPQEKRAIVAKACRLGMNVSELMRAGAATFNPAPEDLLELVRAAQESIDRSIAAVDAAMVGVAQGSARIKVMEAKAARAGACGRRDVQQRATAAGYVSSTCGAQSHEAHRPRHGMGSEGAFVVEGSRRQHVIIVPSANIIRVRRDSDPRFDIDHFTHDVLGVLKGDAWQVSGLLRVTCTISITAAVRQVMTAPGTNQSSSRGACMRRTAVSDRQRGCRQWWLGATVTRYA